MFPRRAPRQIPLKHEFFAIVPRGFEDVAASELEALGAAGVEPGISGVGFSGGPEILYKANLWLRSASRVLMPLREFAAGHPMMLYDQVKRMNWEKWLTPDGTFAIECTLFNSQMTHSHYAELRAKDAVCDRFRERTGRRPSIDKERPDLRIHLFINNDRCILSIDSSGESLHRRGYRVDGSFAPVRENLAAALLLKAGYDGSKPLFDPMCGSGTFLIEAALIAQRRAPGLNRDRFGFMGWPDFDPKLWQQVRREATAALRPLADLPPIVGTEIDTRTVEAARANAGAAGLSSAIKILHRDFRTLTDRAALFPEGGEDGFLITNPPYGERLGVDADLVALHRDLGDLFKKVFSGWTAHVLSANLEAAKFIGLKASRRHPLLHGGLDSRLLRFDLYQGTRKKGPQPPAEAMS